MIEQHAGRPVVERVDAIIGCGMGIGDDGKLSPDSLHIAREVVEMARSLQLGGVTVGAIIGTGGHSWSCELAGSNPPAEGPAMAAEMQSYARKGHNLPAETKIGSEDRSKSTIENTVNAKEELGKLSSPNLVVVTRKSHAIQARFATWLAFPEATRAYAFTSDENPSMTDRAYQTLRFAATCLFMAGVRRGDGRAIMRRQHALEATFAAVVQPVRAVIGSGRSCPSGSNTV